MTNKELTTIVKSLAASVVHHDDQIEANSQAIDRLIKLTERNSEQIEKLQKSIAKTERQWQAYVNTLRPQ